MYNYHNYNSTYETIIPDFENRLQDKYNSEKI